MFSIHARNSETGKVFTYKSRLSKHTITFYAERGLIKIHDESDGSYKVVSRLDFLLRAQAISDAIRRDEPSDERSDQIRLLQTMVLVAKAASDQGDPLSRTAVAGMMKASKRPGRILSAGASWDLHPIPQAPADKPMVPLEALGRKATPGVVAKSSPLVITGR